MTGSPKNSWASMCESGLERKPRPASRYEAVTAKSPSPSLTCSGSWTSVKPCSRNQSRWAPASSYRSRYANSAPSTRPPITVAPLAAKTMSGRSGRG